MNIANALGAKVTVRPRVTAAATTATTATVCDMYAPRTSAGVLLDDATTLLLRRWMDGVADVDVKAPTAFVTARVGSGVSTLLRLLVSELGLEGVWIHAGTPRIADVLEDVGRSRVSVTGRRKIVIVDEFDAVSADKVTISAIVAFAKTGKLRMVCAGHASRSSKASEFATKWVRFDFPRIPTTTIEAYLRSLGFGPAASKVSAKRADGDLRAALNSVNSPDSKDVVVEGLDGVDLVLSRAALTVRDAMVMHEPSVVAMGVFENYHAILAKNDTGIADVVSDAFSMADATVGSRGVLHGDGHRGTGDGDPGTTGTKIHVRREIRERVEQSVQRQGQSKKRENHQRRSFGRRIDVHVRRRSRVASSDRDDGVGDDGDGRGDDGRGDDGRGGRGTYDSRGM